jgi:hypothetical protein
VKLAVIGLVKILLLAMLLCGPFGGLWRPLVTWLERVAHYPVGLPHNALHNYGAQGAHLLPV